jgi:Flp pilus assembly protein TadB
MYPNQYLVAIVITSVIMISAFTFVSVSAWADQRRREREAFYRSEVLKKLADATGTQAQQVLEMMREQDRDAERRLREGMKLAGLIMTGVGIGLIAMFALLTSNGTWGIGLIPLLIGLALLVYTYVLAPRTPNGSPS